MVSEELNGLYEQIARSCSGLDLEGRAIVLGVNGPDANANRVFSEGLLARLAGEEGGALFHLRDCTDAAALRRILALEGPLEPEALQRYYEEGTDQARARRAIQELSLEKRFLVAEGEFLFTDALSDLFDVRVYLDATPEKVRARMAEGDRATHERVAGPAFAHYAAEFSPAVQADFVIDVNDLDAPRAVTPAL